MWLRSACGWRWPRGIRCGMGHCLCACSCTSLHWHVQPAFAHQQSQQCAAAGAAWQCRDWRTLYRRAHHGCWLPAAPAALTLLLFNSATAPGTARNILDHVLFKGVFYSSLASLTLPCLFWPGSSSEAQLLTLCACSAAERCGCDGGCAGLPPSVLVDAALSRARVEDPMFLAAHVRAGGVRRCAHAPVLHTHRQPAIGNSQHATRNPQPATGRTRCNTCAAMQRWFCTDLCTNRSYFEFVFVTSCRGHHRWPPTARPGTHVLREASRFFPPSHPSAVLHPLFTLLLLLLRTLWVLVAVFHRRPQHAAGYLFL